RAGGTPRPLQLWVALHQRTPHEKQAGFTVLGYPQPGLHCLNPIKHALVRGRGFHAEFTLQHGTPLSVMITHDRGRAGLQPAAIRCGDLVENVTGMLVNSAPSPVDLPVQVETTILVLSPPLGNERVGEPEVPAQVAGPMLRNRNRVDAVHGLLELVADHALSRSRQTEPRPGMPPPGEPVEFASIVAAPLRERPTGVVRDRVGLTAT